MRSEIDYLVGQLKQLDTIIDAKNKESKEMARVMAELQGQIKVMKSDKDSPSKGMEAELRRREDEVMRKEAEMTAEREFARATIRAQL